MRGEDRNGGLKGRLVLLRSKEPRWQMIDRKTAGTISLRQNTVGSEGSKQLSSIWRIPGLDRMSELRERTSRTTSRGKSRKRRISAGSIPVRHKDHICATCLRRFCRSHWSISARDRTLGKLLFRAKKQAQMNNKRWVR